MSGLLSSAVPPLAFYQVYTRPVCPVCLWRIIASPGHDFYIYIGCLQLPLLIAAWAGFPGDHWCCHQVLHGPHWQAERVGQHQHNWVTNMWTNACQTFWTLPRGPGFNDESIYAPRPRTNSSIYAPRPRTNCSIGCKLACIV
jgi:hypothetical protein